MKIAGVLSFLSLFLIGCTSDTDVNTAEDLNKDQDAVSIIPKSQEAVFEPSFETVDIPFHEFEYSDEHGLTFDMETGSRIEIPARAFEDTDGNSVTRNIKIKYREFHSVSDIMLSGIKMKYNEGDTSEADFESAGMFEIRAFQNGAELRLRKNKKIKVDLASFKPGEFNNYRMDEETSNWEFLEKKAPQPNTRKKKKIKTLDSKLKDLETVCDIEPREYKKGMEVFDLDYDLGRFHELTFVNEAMWICVGSDSEKKALKTSLSGFDDMELVPTDSCNIFKLNVWKKNGTASVLNKKTFSVVPVWTGKALDRVRKNYKNKLSELKKVQNERQVAEREADLWRSFELKGMGVYNCDRVMDYLKFITVSLAVIFKDKIKSFFYITNNGTVAIKYYEYKFSEFKVNPNSENSILAILPDNKIGIVSEDEFEAALDIYQRSNDPAKTLELQIREQEIPVTDKKSFDQCVAKF